MNEIDQPSREPIGNDRTDLLTILTIVVTRWKFLTVVSIAAGAVALCITYLIAPTYTARTSFLPPQQQQSAAASALASLGALSGLTGMAVKTPGDQIVSLMQSTRLEDRIVDRFKLMTVYDSKYRFEARQSLENHVRISLGKKDGLIVVEVDASSPALAADIANQYVIELRRLTGELALTEAQERRVFFEGELKRTQANLTQAQNALQNSGFNPGALKTAPQAEAEAYARIKAEATTAQVRLESMRHALADGAPEVQQQLGVIAALKEQLAKLEIAESPEGSADYVSRYREFKYEETLFELFSKQYEMARLDESHEGGMIQVVDAGMPPEYKSRPKRAFVAIITTVLVWMVLALGLVARRLWQDAKADPIDGDRYAQLGRAGRRN
jgi:capsule polysaccharide export protein KpsE/RkpR